MFKRSMKKRAVFLLSAWAVLSSQPEGWSLSVAPGRTEIRLAPGKKLSFEITVRNDTDRDLDIETAMRDWFVLEVNKGLKVEDWLKIVKPKHFHLKPDESQKVKLTARSPKKGQGELVGMVSFICQTNPPSMVTPVISVSVYLAIAGTENPAGEIKSVDVMPIGQGVRLMATLKATGNVHLRPTGFIQIYDEGGTEMAKVPVMEGSPTYPGNERMYAADSPTLALKPGKYSLQANLSSQGLAFKSSRTFEVGKDGHIQMDKGTP
jgi:hypothetical protein